MTLTGVRPSACHARPRKWGRQTSWTHTQFCPFTGLGRKLKYFACVKIRNGFVGSCYYTSKSDEGALTESINSRLKPTFYTMVILLIFYANILDAEMTFLSNSNLHSMFLTSCISVLYSYYLEMNTNRFFPHLLPPTVQSLLSFVLIFFVFLFSFHFSPCLKFLRFIFHFCLVGPTFSRWLCLPFLYFIPSPLSLSLNVFLSSHFKF